VCLTAHPIPRTQVLSVLDAPGGTQSHGDVTALGRALGVTKGQPLRTEKDDDNGGTLHLVVVFFSVELV
jgi:hypothetical protein